MNKIEAVMHKHKFGRGECAWLAIDGEPIENWFDQKVEADTTGLALAQIWLYDEEEDKLAWQRISELGDETSTIVPVLVCSDDMDLSCTVIVVEQTINREVVEWTRSGFSMSSGLQTGSTVKWFKEDSHIIASFKKSEFEESLKDFKQLMKNNS